MAKSIASYFESKTCGRCGGSGRYSYNQIDGDRCYGCNGSTRVLTTRGHVALRFFRDLRTVKISELKPGDTIRTTSVTFKIMEIRTSGSKWLHKDSNTWHAYIDVVGTDKRGRETILGFLDMEGTVERIPASIEEGKAQLQQALDYQATLTQAGKPKKGM